MWSKYKVKFIQVNRYQRFKEFQAKSSLIIHPNCKHTLIVFQLNETTTSSLPLFYLIIHGLIATQHPVQIIISRESNLSASAAFRISLASNLYPDCVVESSIRRDSRPGSPCQGYCLHLLPFQLSCSRCQSVSRPSVCMPWSSSRYRIQRPLLNSSLFAQCVLWHYPRLKVKWKW